MRDQCFIRLLGMRQNEAESKTNIKNMRNKIIKRTRHHPEAERIRAAADTAMEHLIAELNPDGQLINRPHNCAELKEITKLLTKEFSKKSLPGPRTPPGSPITIIPFGSTTADYTWEYPPTPGTEEPTIITQEDNSQPMQQENEGSHTEDIELEINQPGTPIDSIPETQQDKEEQISPSSPEDRESSIDSTTPRQDETNSHNETGTFRINIDEIISHHYRKKGTFFKVQWEGFYIKSEEPIESAMKGKRAMTNYIKGLKTRGRNTLLKRHPQLGMFLQK